MRNEGKDKKEEAALNIETLMPMMSRWSDELLLNLITQTQHCMEFRIQYLLSQELDWY
jgi:hypothetical protein